MRILFDIGRSKMRIAATKDHSTILGDPVVVDTPELFSDIIDTFARHARELSDGEWIESIGGGITQSPELDWESSVIRDEIKEKLNTDVYIENDTAVVGLGEMHHGAGRDYALGVYMTVSTGVGGAKFENGVIDQKTSGFEPGHQIIDAGKALCADCAGPTLEEYVGGAATSKRLNKKPYDIPQDDPLWEQYAEWLSYGLRNTILHWSPEVVVLGGSMIIGDPNIPFNSIIRHTEEQITQIFKKAPDIKKAELGDVGGLYGAMVLLDQKRGTGDTR